MNTIEIKTDLSGEELLVLIWELKAFCEGKRLPKPVLRQTDVISSLPINSQVIKVAKAEAEVLYPSRYTEAIAYQSGYVDGAIWMRDEAGRQ